MGFPGGLVVKNLPASAGDTGRRSSIPGLGRSLEEEAATHFSILSWKIPWTEEPGRLQSRVGAVDQKLFTRLAGIDLFKLLDTVDHILFSQISLKLIFQKVFNTGLFTWLIHLSSVPPVKSGKSLG